MKKNFNKKKINLLSGGKLVKYLIIFSILILIIIKIYDEIENKARFNKFIQDISEKLNYQFDTYEVNNLHRVDKNEISKIMNKYLDQSIFLIPLNIISDSLKNIKWIKNVNISTNLKNKVKIEIFEYKPIGLFFFNEQIFYFSEKGKIIGKYNENINENFIIFYGNEALNKADHFLKILNKNQHPELLKIKKAFYINERRWNIKLENEILVYLSEKNIEESFKNYIKLIKELNDSEIISIKSIDLRNNEKAILSLK